MAALCALCIAQTASAQQLRPIFGLEFDVRFDNREYDHPLGTDQTFFGLKVTPQGGFGWGGNALMVGVDITRDFGAKGSRQPDPELMLYYRYMNHGFTAYAGIFQRSKLGGNYPSAFFTSSVKFYDPMLEGALLRYHGRHGYAEVACDWHSKIGETQREKFLLISSGFLRPNHRTIFFGGYYFTMHHFAGTLTQSGVVDNLLVNPYIGVDIPLSKPFSASVNVGWLQAFQNDRENVGDFVTPGGFISEQRFKWRSLGLFNTVYLGDNLMPYYDTYGGSLYLGDPFFRTEEGFYDRLEIYWQAVSKKGMTLKLSSVHHFPGDKWGWQQVVSLSIDLNTERKRGRAIR